MLISNIYCILVSDSKEEEAEDLTVCHNEIAANYKNKKCSYMHDIEPSINDYQDCPELALIRRSEMEYLTDYFEKLNRDYNMRLKRDVLVRWLFSQKSLEKESEFRDPLFPYSAEYRKDVGLFYEFGKRCRQESKMRDFQKILIKTVNEIAEYLRKWKSDGTYRVESNKIGDFYTLGLENSSTFKEKHRISTRTEVKIKESVFEKLQKFYKQNDHDDSLFLSRLYTMICRYQTLGGEGYQAAVKKNVFEFLQENLGVVHECFASPLNCTLSSFGSAFYDTDRYFGSIGPFYTLRGRFKEGGSFQANPPFIEDTMHDFATYILSWMEEEVPLSFSVFLPAWNDALGYILMKESKFLKHNLHFPKWTHQYINGSHYYSQKNSLISFCDSYVLFLQNDLGAKKWPLPSEKIERFRDLFTK